MVFLSDALTCKVVLQSWGRLSSSWFEGNSCVVQQARSHYIWDKDPQSADPLPISRSNWIRPKPSFFNHRLRQKQCLSRKVGALISSGSSRCVYSPFPTRDLTLTRPVATLRWWRPCLCLWSHSLRRYGRTRVGSGSILQCIFHRFFSTSSMLSGLSCCFSLFYLIHGSYN